MKTADAISEILNPVNHILERAAAAGIRPIIVRQERTGLHMAEAISRVTSAKKSSASSRCSMAPALKTPTVAWRGRIASLSRS